MIFGIGTDIVAIERIQKAVNKNPRFAHKVLGMQEYQIYEKRNYNTAFLAKRFAAKEACAKALGIGFRFPITWHDLQIISCSLGKPQFLFSGNLLIFINQHNYTCHVSLSDEKRYAVAYVIIEK